MARSRSRVALLLLLTFAAGLAGGVAIERHLLGGDEGTRAGRGARGQTTIERFADDLGLTQDQRTRIDPILEETRERMNSVFARVRPEYEQVIDSARAKIEAILDAEQVARYRELLRKHERE